MSDRKFTDDEIIKALECCRDFGDCSLCPYAGATFEDEPDCAEKMHTDALALINRQKASLQEVITLNSKLEAENAKLQRLLDFYEKTSGNKKAKAEAIRAFAERLKANMSNIAGMEYGGNIYFCVGYDLIDTLVKEMTEEKTNEFPSEST